MTLPGLEFPKNVQWLVHASRWTAGGLMAKAASGDSTGGRAGPVERGYVPGDDYHAIDWNVCARHDELVWRRPDADADRRVYVLLDCSRSMATGRPPKFDVARRAAAAFGAAALGRLDGLAVLAFTDRIIAEFPPVRGRSYWLKMDRFLDALSPGGASTALGRAAECLAGRRQRPGVAVVIGDFLNPESDRRGLEILRYHGHAVCGVHVCDRADARPDVLGDVELVDVETGRRWVSVLGRRDLARYRVLFEEHCRAVRTFCRQRAVGYLRMQEETSWPRLVFEASGRTERVL